MFSQWIFESTFIGLSVDQWPCAHHLYPGYVRKTIQASQYFLSPHGSEYHINIKFTFVRIMSVRSCVVRWAQGVIFDLPCTRAPSLQNSKATTTGYGR